MVNCPFDVPKINKETHKSTKCDLCFDRIEEGMTPSCAKTCTADALQFAPYEEIEEIVRQRVKELQEDGYPDANVFNPQGVGGVHMIYVLPEKPEVYGFSGRPRRLSPSTSGRTSCARSARSPVSVRSLACSASLPSRA